MKRKRGIILWCTAVLFLLWLTLNFSRLTAGQNGIIRLVLGGVFSVLILLRRNLRVFFGEIVRPLDHAAAQDAPAPGTASEPSGLGWIVSAAAILGTVLSLGGIILGVHQFKWLGLLLVIYAGLRWALPACYSWDILLSLFLFYWIHPLPGQVFGPLQLAMQGVSVQGSEWLLHSRNVRVWADGMILRTGIRTFGVPESCSGMRTGITVLLCALGIGILLRFKWTELIVLVTVGLAQVLALNILRISFMALMADRRPDEWATTFLHDTLGIFLLAAIFLVQLEASLWSRSRLRRRLRAGPPARPFPVHETPEESRPPFFSALIWRSVLKWAVVVFVVLLAAGGVAFGVFKRRPYHRATMISTVVDRLAWRKELVDAERACSAALDLLPESVDLRTKRVQILLLRGKHEEALAELDRIADEKRTMFHSVLKARALMGLNRPNDAIALINALPEDVRGLPGVAMLRAEFAAMRDDTEEVVENIVKAATWHLMIHKVRALLPYLAEREEWETITRCRTKEPYQDITNALIAVHAHLKIEDLAGAEEILHDGMAQWPDDQRFGRYLAAIAKIRSEETWNRPLADMVKDIVRAADWHLMIDRVRSLFPYLAVRQQWRTIAGCHSPAPYRERTNALIAVYAHLKVRDLGGAWDILKAAMDQWPDEPMFLQYLAGIVAARPGTEWEAVFADRFKFNLGKLGADELTAHIETGFQISRPDLVWLAYSRLREIDPRHPALSLALAGFGDVWFTFRKHYAGIPAMSEFDKIDLKQFCRTRHRWPVAPLLTELTTGDLTARRKQYVHMCLEELGKREGIGLLSPWTETVYSTVLKLSGRRREAEDKLDAIAKMYTGKSKRIQAINTVDRHLKTGDALGAWEALKPAMKEWPREPMFLRQLAEMAETQPGSVWDRFFAHKLKSELDILSADQLGVCVQAAFRMSRPDLAWLAYGRLGEIDPRNPGLYLAPAQFGDAWFVFRKRAAGIPALSDHEAVDLKTLYLKSRDWPTIPMAKELTADDAEQTRSGHLQICLRELERREHEGELRPRMQILYATALKLAGRYDEAHTRLDAADKAYPVQKEELLFKHAEIYEKQKDWGKLYETVREYGLLTDQPRFAVSLMKISALMHLDLGVCALAVGNRALKTFPGAPEIHQAAAAVWAAWEAPEEALFLLSHIEGLLDGAHESPFLPDLYQATERFSEAKRTRQAYRMEPLPPRSGMRQRVLLPRAELAITPQWGGGPLTKEQMEGNARRSAAGAAACSSPFVRNLEQARADWFRTQGAEKSSDPARWIAVGRDAMEQAMALNELTMLLARQRRLDEAAKTAKQAVGLFPDSAMLWRAWIGLTEGESEWEIIGKARRACPTDSEIWLAYLVARKREDGPGDWAVAEVEEAGDANRFSVGTMVRAGDFFRRHGLRAAAAKAARYAQRNCRGLLPAHVLALRCAMVAKDMEWAVSSAANAAEHALDPWPFYRVIAEIKTGALSTDMVTVSVLEKLCAHFPREARWTVKLGDVYFRRGDAERAFSVLGPLVEEKSKEIDVRTVLLAAEAARQVGELEKAVAILEVAYARDPANRMVLNNLVYTLALDGKTLARSRRLLAKLLEMSKRPSLPVLDTAALVYRQIGDTARAERYLKEALQLAEEVEPWWPEMNRSTIDIETYLGKHDDRIDEGLSDSKKQGFKVLRARLVPLAKELSKKLKDKAKTNR